MSPNPGHIGLATNVSPPDSGDMTLDIERRTAELMSNPAALLNEVIYWDAELMREFETAVNSLVAVSEVVGKRSPCVCQASAALTEVYERAAEKKAREEIDRRFA